MQKEYEEKNIFHRDRGPMHCLNKDNDEIIETNYEEKTLKKVTSSHFK
jgi:hypothetical protein